MLIWHLSRQASKILNQLFTHLWQFAVRNIDTPHPKHGPELLHLLSVLPDIVTAWATGHICEYLLRRLILLHLSHIISLVGSHPLENRRCLALNDFFRIFIGSMTQRRMRLREGVQGDTITYERIRRCDYHLLMIFVRVIVFFDFQELMHIHHRVVPFLAAWLLMLRIRTFIH
jgi:hypothetical protein